MLLTQGDVVTSWGGTKWNGRLPGVELQVRVASGRIGRLSLGKADKLGRQLRKVIEWVCDQVVAVT